MAANGVTTLTLNRPPTAVATWTGQAVSPFDLFMHFHLITTLGYAQLGVNDFRTGEASIRKFTPVKHSDPVGRLLDWRADTFPVLTHPRMRQVYSGLPGPWSDVADVPVIRLLRFQPGSALPKRPAVRFACGEVDIERG